MRIDLNCDLGESFGAYKIGMDEEVIPHITSANIACGFHAGDPEVMARTVRLCREYGVCAGAHPGYRDLQGFGRRQLQVAPETVKCEILYQVGALRAFCDSVGIPLTHVKPHGALYNQAAKSYDLALAICEGIRAADPQLAIMAMSGSCMVKAAQDCGLPYISEVFADRAYQADGTLVPRSREGAMITDEDEAIRRVVRMAREGTVTAITGEEVSVQADSVCVHGDGAKALAFVRKIRSALEAEGITVAAPCRV